MPKRPAKKALETAVHTMRLYLGCSSDMRARHRDVQKLYDRTWRKVRGIAKTTGLDANNAWSQIEAEARKRGLKCPLPGIDI
jgi:hypothetical protein